MVPRALDPNLLKFVIIELRVMFLIMGHLPPSLVKTRRVLGSMRHLRNLTVVLVPGVAAMILVLSTPMRAL